MGSNNYAEVITDTAQAQKVLADLNRLAVQGRAFKVLEFNPDTDRFTISLGRESNFPSLQPVEEDGATLDGPIAKARWSSHGDAAQGHRLRQRVRRPVLRIGRAGLHGYPQRQEQQGLILAARSNWTEMQTLESTNKTSAASATDPVSSLSSGTERSSTSAPTIGTRAMRPMCGSREGCPLRK
jgi:hypothetical protein